MEKGARRTGKTAWEIAQLYTEAFLVDMQRAQHRGPDGPVPRDRSHRASRSSSSPTSRRTASRIATSDGIYFDTSKQPDYGYLARLDVAGLEAGKRVDARREAQRHRFRAVEILAAGRAAPDGMGQPVGHGLSRLAHRVLGDGAEVPRRLLRHPLRRRGPHSGPSHQRDRADRGARRHAAREFLDARLFPAAERRQDGEVGGRVPARQVADRARLRSAGVPLPVPDRALPRRS